MFVTGLKTVLFTIFVPGTVTVVIPYLLLAHDLEIYSFALGKGRFIGILPVSAGLVYYFWSAWNFVVVGKGTPAPIDPPKKLVVRGPFKTVRNPMYGGGVFILLGESMIFASLTLVIYTFFIWLAFHLFVVLYEERHLKKIFCASYEEYCKTVPRWIPKFRWN